MPLLIFCAIIVAQFLAEYVAMRRTGTLRRKHRREWTAYAIALPFKGMLAVALVEHVNHHTGPTAAMLLLGSLLALAGIAVRVRCHFDLNGAFSMYVERPGDSAVVTAGMYAKIRHPMYLGSVLLFIGMPLILAAEWAWLFTLLGILGLAVRIRREERFLTNELPGYREYMRKTWRLLPYIY